MESRRPGILQSALAVLAGMGGAMAMGGVRLERPSGGYGGPKPKPKPERDYPPKVEAKLVYHRHGHWDNRKSRRELRAVNAGEQRRINRLTNWQRNQWARAGYPKNRIDEFAAMERGPAHA